MLEARKRGDLAFRDKDFRTAIECYSQVNICLRGLIICACILNLFIYIETDLEGQNLQQLFSMLPTKFLFDAFFSFSSLSLG